MHIPTLLKNKECSCFAILPIQRSIAMFVYIFPMLWAARLKASYNKYNVIVLRAKQENNEVIQAEVVGQFAQFNSEVVTPAVAPAVSICSAEPSAADFAALQIQDKLRNTTNTNENTHTAGAHRGLLLAHAEASLRMVRWMGPSVVYESTVKLYLLNVVSGGTHGDLSPGRTRISPWCSGIDKQYCRFWYTEG